ATVHPWYIVFLLLLSLYTDYKFPIIWSALVFLSYAAYSNSNFEENYLLLMIEYFLVIGMMLYEILTKKGRLLSIQKN
ncbi:MAG: mannosyltransferase, partial [Eudoraea sp.]